MKAKDMREKSVEDLAELEKSLVSGAFQARFKNFTNRLDDTSALKKARRDIARVKTILTERATKIAASTKEAPAKHAQVATKSVAKAPAKAAGGTKAKTAGKASKSVEASK